ncbi:hypothetical protein K3172_11180 [Qipengyuania sp. 6B39]|uniref:hypothetical protein n=1 Tax=Qipengyuania proteolytica TaxID=2867239 RepID=UPI001C898309|nr:hypothetical protein [Qipengyuania proteolytica]MBX7496416.1 hypothetical protein [Qipengyuania proteolytica]
MTRRWPSLPSIVVRLAIFIAIAVLATAFQADRWARKNPAIMAVVPEGLGGFADLHRLVLLESVEPGSGLALAKSLVASRPIPAEPLRLLGNSAIEKDETELASQALSLASQRGWRDTFTQIAVMASAIAAEEWDAAALRVDAMARTARDRRLIENGLALMLAQSGGREAVAERLEEGAPLSISLVGLIRSDESRVEQVVATFAAAEEGGGQLSCSSYANLVDVLLAKGYGVEAIGVWPRRCQTETSADFAFDLDAVSDDPLAWRYPDNSGLRVSAGDDEGSIDIRNRAVLRRAFATRYLTLPPGEHFISLSQSQADAAQGELSGQAAATLQCVGRGSAGMRPLVESDDALRIRFVVPQGCTTQRLSLTASRGKVTSFRIAVD